MTLTFYFVVLGSNGNYLTFDTTNDDTADAVDFRVDGRGQYVFCVKEPLQAAKIAKAFSDEKAYTVTC